MKTALRQKALELRIKNRLSYSAIQKVLKVSRSTLSYWLEEYPLTKKEIGTLQRRAWLRGEASRERFRISMREKRSAIEKEIYQKQKEKIVKLGKGVFFTAGLMLYLGEGDKRNRARVGLANADPAVIKFFIKWLGESLDVEKNSIHIELHLYENMNITKEENFWIKTTGVSRKKFYKTQIKKVQKKFLYTGPQRHGACSIIVNSVEKKRKLMMGIKAVLDLYESGI